MENNTRSTNFNIAFKPNLNKPKISKKWTKSQIYQLFCLIDSQISNIHPYIFWDKISEIVNKSGYQCFLKYLQITQMLAVRNKSWFELDINQLIDIVLAHDRKLKKQRKLARASKKVSRDYKEVKNESLVAEASKCKYIENEANESLDLFKKNEDKDIFNEITHFEIESFTTNKPKAKTDYLKKSSKKNHIGKFNLFYLFNLIKINK